MSFMPNAGTLVRLQDGRIAAVLSDGVGDCDRVIFEDGHSEHVDQMKDIAEMLTEEPPTTHSRLLDYVKQRRVGGAEVRTVSQALERLGFTDDMPLSELLAPAQFAGVASIGVDRYPRMRQLYDYGKVLSILVARGLDDAEDVAKALACCHSMCGGCLAADGRGCYAIALFHAYTAETGLPTPPFLNRGDDR